MNWGLLQNSLLVAGSAALLATMLGCAFAIFASGLGKRLRAIAIAAGIIALVLPPFLVANTWLEYFGLAGSMRRLVNFNLYSLPGTVLLITLSTWPVAFLITLGSLLRMEAVYLEQEPFLRGWASIKFLLWPVCRASAGYSFALSFVLALNNFSIPVLLQTKVYTEEVWLAFSTRFDYETALKLSWPLILGPMLLLLALRFKPARFVFRSTELRPALIRERLGLLYWTVAIFGGIVVALSIVFPTWQLVASSRTWTEFLPAIQAGKNATMNSALFAVTTALLVSLLATATRRKSAPVWMWLFFLAPGVLLGIALIWLFNRPPLTAFYQSVGIVLFAYCLRFFALGWSGSRLALKSVDPASSDAVALCGGNRFQRFRFAEWPQSRNAMLASAYLVFLFCLWEVETLLLIVPPGRETLALRVFNMLHYGHAGQVNALCVWLLILAMAPLIAMTLYSLGKRLTKIALVALLLCVTGCTEPPPGTVKLRSEIFSTVKVIGSRGTGAGQFNKPRSVAVDGSDNLYVVDLTGRVQKFSPDGQYLLSWIMPQTDIGKPKGMIKDCEGNVVVVEPHYSRLNHFDPNGKLLAQWGVNGTNESKLQFPRAVAVNSRGEMYVSEYGLVERVQRFKHRGEFIQAFGSPGTAPGQFNRPEGLGIGPDDRVYVADSCNHRVQVFSYDGRLLGAFGCPGSGPGEMSYPYDIRIDALGNRFVCEFGNSRVQVFDADGRFVEILGGAGDRPGEMNNPWAIALDSHGNLYVADSANHRVQKFTRREPLGVANGPTQQTEASQQMASR